MKSIYILASRVVSKGSCMSPEDWSKLRQEEGIDYSSPQKYERSVRLKQRSKLITGRIINAFLADYEDSDLCIGGVGDFCKESQLINNGRQITAIDYDLSVAWLLKPLFPKVNFLTYDLKDYDFHDVPIETQVYLDIGTWYNFSYLEGVALMNRLTKRFKTIILVDTTARYYSHYSLAGVILQAVMRIVDYLKSEYLMFTQPCRFYGYSWQRRDFKRIEWDCNLKVIKEIPMMIPTGGIIRIYEGVKDVQH